MTKLVITGNPGVGKHTSAKLVIQRIGFGSIIDINKLAFSHNAVLRRSTRYGVEIDTKKLAKMLTTLLEESKGVIIIVGHLAPYVLESGGVDLAIVLRRSPYELTKVLKRRKYSLHKIKENVASEILDISLYDSLQTFGEEKISELDTTRRTPGHTANEIIRLLRQTRKRKFGTVDWLSLVHKNGDLNKFLEY